MRLDRTPFVALVPLKTSDVTIPTPLVSGPPTAHQTRRKASVSQHIYARSIKEFRSAYFYFLRRFRLLIYVASTYIICQFFLCFTPILPISCRFPHYATFAYICHIRILRERRLLVLPFAEEVFCLCIIRGVADFGCFLGRPSIGMGPPKPSPIRPPLTLGPPSNVFTSAFDLRPLLHIRWGKFQRGS